MITIDHVVDIAGDEVSLGHVRLTASSVLIAEATRIAVFDLQGRFKRYLGREGAGPGEFSQIQAVVPITDEELAVFEALPPRLTVLDTAGVSRRTAVLPTMLWRGSAVRLSDGSYVLGGTMLSRSNFGSPLVHVSAGGQLVGYLGTNELETEGFGMNLMMPRVLGYHERFGLFAAKSHKYVVESWGVTDRQLLSLIRREVPWFGAQPELPEGHEGSGGFVLGPPENVVKGLQIDDAGRAWTIVEVAAEDWAGGLSPDRRSVVSREDWTDTRIEVLDLSTKEALCSASFEGFVTSGFVAPDHLASYREDRNGNPTISIWRLGLESALPEDTGSD
jgi:hypothetical protein